MVSSQSLSLLVMRKDFLVSSSMLLLLMLSIFSSSRRRSSCWLWEVNNQSSDWNQILKIQTEWCPVDNNWMLLLDRLVILLNNYSEKQALEIENIKIEKLTMEWAAFCLSCSSLRVRRSTSCLIVEMVWWLAPSLSSCCLSLSCSCS